MARITVVGSVAWDRVIHLKEPMREGAHLEGIDRGDRLGGGGANTAVGLASAGHRVTVVSAVGEDADGERLLDELRERGVETTSVARIDGATTRSVVMTDAVGERTIVNLARARELSPPRRLLDIPADLLYVRSRSVELAPLMAEMTSLCSVVAHVPPLDSGTRPAHVLLGSQTDLPRSFLRKPFESGLGIAGDRLQWMVVTMGADGAVAYGRDGILRMTAPVVEAVDTTGAGDAFAAGLVHALAGRQPMEAALAVAVEWGAESIRWESSVLPREAMERLNRSAA